MRAVTATITSEKSRCSTRNSRGLGLTDIVKDLLSRFSKELGQVNCDRSAIDAQGRTDRTPPLAFNKIKGQGVAIENQLGVMEEFVVIKHLPEDFL